MTLDHRRGFAWALGAALGIAAFNIPWKLASQHGGAASNALLLLVAAALFNTVLTVAQQRALPRFTRTEVLVATGLAGLTVVANVASATAIRGLSPALLTVTQRSEIIIVALLAWPIVGERVERRFWLGAGLALVGLVILNDPFSAPEARVSSMAWALFSAALFASMAVLTRKFIHRIDAIAVNGLRLWLAVLLWFAWYGAPETLREVTPVQVAYTSLAALLGPFAGRLCLMTSARYLEARMTTLTTLAAPPTTLLLGVVFLNDLPDSRDLLGGAIILGGIAIPILAWARPSVTPPGK